MRKALFVLALSVYAVFAVFAGDRATKEVGFYGYYKTPTNDDDTMRILVRDHHENIINLGSVELDAEYIGRETKVFSWELIGKNSGTVKITFSFAALQAYLNNKYYIPAYTLKMYNKSNLTLSSGSATNQVSKIELVYPSTNTISISYSGAIGSTAPSGYATINVTDIATDEGSYEYRSIVNVTLEAQ